MDLSDQFKITLVGCGAVSEILYAPVIGKLIAEGEPLDVSLVDHSEERIEKIYHLLPSARKATLSDIRKELDKNLLIVALPHSLHCSVALEAFGAGAHVFCEKPMARTVEECDLMIDAAKNADRLLAVGHLRRFFPVTKLIRDWIQGARLGKLTSFRFLEGQTYSWPAISASFFRHETAGGGVLIDRGVHTLDLLLWWAGPIAELDYSDDAAGGVEANCVIRLKTEAGASGYVQLSWDWPLANQYFLDFEKGWLLYTCDVANSFQWGWHGAPTSQRVVIEEAVRLGFDRLPKSRSVASTLVSCFELQLRNVLAAIKNQESLVCPGTEARHVIALIKRCYRERKPLRQPWLSEREACKFEKL